MRSPKITIVMGIYNCEGTLAEAIDSILAQTYSNWELVMCDDASQDGTYRIAEEYQKRYPERIVLLHNERNRKLSYTLNRCLEVASGELIARMDGDDISHQQRLERQITYLLEHPEIQLVGTAMRRFDEKGYHDVMHPIILPDRWTLKRRTPFYHATILTYKSVFDALGGYTDHERVIRLEDRDLWFRFFAAGFNGANLDEALYDVRENTDTIRRRTFRTRLKSLRVTRDGFRMLGFPKRWLVEEVALILIKSMIPYSLKQQIRMIKENRLNV